MALTSSSTALTVYETTLPKEFTRERLMKYAFQPILDGGSVLSFGAVPYESPLAADLATAWNISVPERGYFIHFAFRIDTRRVPPALLKKYIRAAMDEEKRVTNKPTVSKSRRTEIKEREKLRLIAKTEPVPAVYDVVLDAMTGRLFFGAATKRVKDTFTSWWNNSFSEVLVEKTPDALARDLMDDPPTGVEFLTKLYDDGPAEDSGDGSVDSATGEVECWVISVQNKVSLHAGLTSMAISATNLAEVDKAVASLPAVPLVFKAKLAVTVAGDEYSVTVRGDDLGMTGLKTPKVDTRLAEGEDPDGPFLEKMHLIERVVDVMQKAYRQYAKGYKKTEVAA